MENKLRAFNMISNKLLLSHLVLLSILFFILGFKNYNFSLSNIASNFSFHLFLLISYLKTRYQHSLKFLKYLCLFSIVLNSKENQKPF